MWLRTDFIWQSVADGQIHLSTDEPENGLRPSVSYLFRSVAQGVWPEGGRRAAHRNGKGRRVGVEVDEGTRGGDHRARPGDLRRARYAGRSDKAGWGNLRPFSGKDSHGADKPREPETGYSQRPDIANPGNNAPETSNMFLGRQFSGRAKEVGRPMDEPRKIVLQQSGDTHCRRQPNPGRAVESLPERARLYRNRHQERKARRSLAALESKPAMVITDVVMPEMDGYTLCKEIKSSADSQGRSSRPTDLSFQAARHREGSGVRCGQLHSQALRRKISAFAG